MKRQRPIRLISSTIALVALGTTGCFGDEPIDFGDPLNGAVDTANLPGDGGIGTGSTDVASTDAVGCNPNGEPTWDTPVDQIMQTQCTSCHPETATYDDIQVWVNNGLLEQYCLMGPSHFLTSGEEQCLRWIEINAPKSDCDVAPN